MCKFYNKENNITRLRAIFQSNLKLKSYIYIYILFKKIVLLKYQYKRYFCAQLRNKTQYIILSSL